MASFLSLLCPCCSSDDLVVVDRSPLDHRPLRQCRACGARLGPRPLTLTLLYLAITVVAFLGSMFVGILLIRVYWTGLGQPHGAPLPIVAPMVLLGLVAAPQAILLILREGFRPPEVHVARKSQTDDSPTAESLVEQGPTPRYVAFNPQRQTHSHSITPGTWRTSRVSRRGR